MASPDFQSFVTPENNWAGLYKTADNLEKLNLRKQTLALQEQGRQAANTKFLANYLDPIKYLTGTNYDPVTTQLLTKALDQAYDLSSKGASLDQIMMATSPIVNQANDYMQKAKMYSTNKKQILDNLKEDKGYDVSKLSDLLDDKTFYKTDPKTGQKTLDINNADPTLKTPMNDIMQNNLSDITSDKGFDEWADKSKLLSGKEKIVTMNRSGQKIINDINTTRTNWEMPIKDKNGATVFVPKYNQGEYLVDPETGKQTPLLDKGVFEDIMSKNGSTADWVKGQLQKELKSGDYKDDNGNPITLNSPQAYDVARAIAWQKLLPKVRGRVDVDKESLIVKMGGAGKTPGELTLNNVYTPLANTIKKANSKGISYPTGNEIPSDASTVIMKSLKDQGYKDLNAENVKVGLDNMGNVQVFYSDRYLADNPDIKDPLITTLSPTNVLTSAKQPGVGEKREAVKTGQQLQTPQNNQPTIQKSTNEMFDVKGKPYNRKQLQDMGYTDDQINQALQLGTIKKK